MNNSIYIPVFIMGLLIASSAQAFDQSSPPDSLVVSSEGNVGVGTNSPTYSLHVKGTSKDMLLVENTSVTNKNRRLLQMSNSGPVGFEMTDISEPITWQFRSDGAANFIINNPANLGAEFKVDKTNGNVTIKGSVTANGVLLTSSRTSKTDIVPIKPAEVMEKLKRVELAEWRYKKADKNDRHISPMAEDFYALFQLGPDNKHINPNDLASVAIIAAKELQAENADLKQRLASLEKLVSNLASSNKDLDGRVEKVALIK